MELNRSSCGSNILKGILLFVLLSLLSAPTFAANYSLDIIQPRPNLDVKNRFYKAYPGFEYNVRLGVIGGAYPYSFALTTFPQGMTIDKRGEITWPNPSESGTPYPVTATVTDSENVTKSVSWTITVTKTGFLFVDAINGKSVANGGTGTIDNPFRSMKDWYGGDVIAAKTANTYAGDFIYWRQGTYAMDAFKEDSGLRTAFVSNNKPQVWLAYPGENPIIDLAGGYICIYGGGSNTYFDGLEFNLNANARGMGIQIDSNVNNVTFRRNILHNLNGASTTGGNNSLIFISKGSTPGKDWVIQDNDMHDVHTGYGVLGYLVSNVLVENNVIYDIAGHPIGPKESTTMWFIRANHLYNNSMDSISVQYSNGSGVNSGDIEISYNLVEAGGGQVTIDSNMTSVGGPMYMYRNTFLDKVTQNEVTSTNGPFYWTDNVIVNESSSADKITRNTIVDPTHLIISNNLVGSAADNIVDSQGYLTSNYSSYVGSRGFEIGNRPSPPTALNVQVQ